MTHSDVALPVREPFVPGVQVLNHGLQLQEEQCYHEDEQTQYICML